MEQRRVFPELDRPSLVAHAGGGRRAGGDVIAGIDRVLAAGVRAVELDVRRTRDGVLVVHHGGPAGERSLAAVRHDAGRHPALADVLAHVGGRAAVDLELKEAGYEHAVVELGLAHVGPDRLLITSFLDAALRSVRSAAPAVATGLIVSGRPTRLRPLAPIRDVFPFGRLEACDADVLVAHHALDVTALRARAARHGVPLLLWTVNGKRTLAAALTDERLLGVITDDV